MKTETSQPTGTGEIEPTVTMTAIPVWLMALLFVLLFFGAWYFDLYGGWFDARVYAPYRSVPDLARYQPNSDPDANFVAFGKKLYSENCAVCHMETGVGNPANGCPPLIDSEWVHHEAPDRMIMLISRGLTGPITVNGKVYNTGTMLAVGDSLPGDEKEKSAKIAAIASYVRRHFGELPGVVKPDHAEAVRAGIKDHSGYFTAEDLMKAP
ncbi:MAG TPA: c-type cytochrome [Verrucomicrobiota bacterium]|nr:c-type cytochrome [Verrucomicrobiota bacterium]HNT14921.1 c-type cytochrome [Verrucomicrobiota bacterium]